MTPYLTVDDPDRLVAFVEAAFGAEEMKDQRASGPDGKTLHTAFRVEGCIIETGRAAGSWKVLPAGIHLYVRDADAVYARALKAGGVSLHDVRDMDYGERSGAVRDPCGNHWYIATYAGRPEKKRWQRNRVGGSGGPRHGGLGPDSGGPRLHDPRNDPLGFEFEQHVGFLTAPGKERPPGVAPTAAHRLLLTALPP